MQIANAVVLLVIFLPYLAVAWISPHRHSTRRTDLKSSAMDKMSFIWKHMSTQQHNLHNKKTEEELERERQFNLNTGRALEIIRTQLPCCFQTTNLDCSVFADHVTICYGQYTNSIFLHRSLYSAIVKGLRLTSALSFTQPCINLVNIEYIEDCR